jgi:hypothetical protein
MLTSSDIKRALRDAGLEVYRAQGNSIHVAERVRENLILDSGIRIVIDHGEADEAGPASHRLVVTFVAEAPRSQFPSDERDALFERARRLGSRAIGRGFVEDQERVSPVEDPSDAARVLDERFQVAFTKQVGSIEAALEEVRFALSLSRSVER